MKVFIFDTETTGLVKNSLLALNQQPSIIEFFGQQVDADSGEVLQELEFFCKPSVPYDLEKIQLGDRKTIKDMTGISNADIKDALPFSHYAPRLVELLEGSDAVVAHNLSFDMALVEAECARHSLLVSWPAQKICTVEQTEWIKGHRLNLSDLHEHLFGEKFAGAHRARADVQALTRCFLELYERGEM